MRASYENKDNFFNGGSKVTSMISTAKLYKLGRNFMNADELRAIAAGKLSEYLD